MHERVIIRRDDDCKGMHVLDGRPTSVSGRGNAPGGRDAFVSWNGSRYSVPRQYVDKEVWVRPQQDGTVEVHYGGQQIAQHLEAERKYQVIRRQQHHTGIPLGSRQPAKTLIHLRETAPVVEIRSLVAYESVAMGGAQ